LYLLNYYVIMKLMNKGGEKRALICEYFMLISQDSLFVCIYC